MKKLTRKTQKEDSRCSMKGCNFNRPIDTSVHSSLVRRTSRVVSHITFSLRSKEPEIPPNVFRQNLRISLVLFSIFAHVFACCFSTVAHANPPGGVAVWGAQKFDSRDFDRPFTKLAAGGLHALALKNDGTVVAWGDNEKSQATVPLGLNGVTAISGGRYHSVALKSDGTVVAWGSNAFGQTQTS